ncbi:MAG: phage antirepressor N-terminal domain-containing protein [Roseiflexaceae bacterium]|nr:phage antirepressor N-terminal domain-containing protein [Roseiflexaceae bacterium]MDW8326137.1 phage antirepressor N-terminal domain-containing protein [Anaerolineales bacterium]
MDDPGSSALPSLPRVEQFDFYGDSLTAVIIDGREVALPIRSVCAAIGLDARSQSERLREHDVLAQGLRVVKVPIGNRVQSVLAISRRYLAFWLATITPNLVAEDIRPKLVRYQEELVDLLDALYGEGSTQPATTTGEPSLTALSQQLAAIIAELRVTREAILAAQRRTDETIAAQDVRLSAVEALLNERLTTLAGQLDETQQRLLDQVKITAAQQAVIRLAIERLGKRYETRTGKKIYDLLHARFCAELGTPRYDALPAGKYSQALAWLRARAAEYLPDDPDALPPLQESLL